MKKGLEVQDVVGDLGVLGIGAVEVVMGDVEGKCDVGGQRIGATGRQRLKDWGLLEEEHWVVEAVELVLVPAIVVECEVAVEDAE